MHSITPEQAVAVLNEALTTDPEAINAMFAHRTPCNEKLSDHETIQVRDYEMEGDPSPPNFGVLGLLNGIFGIKPSGYGFIQTESEHGQIVRFSINTT
jgi:hypothetical protein